MILFFNVTFSYPVDGYCLVRPTNRREDGVNPAILPLEWKGTPYPREGSGSALEPRRSVYLQHCLETVVLINRSLNVFLGGKDFARCGSVDLGEQLSYPQEEEIRISSY